METVLWRGLLVVGAAVAVSTQDAPVRMLSFEEAVSYVVRVYNRLEERTSTFRLLEAPAPPDWDPTAESSPQELQLTIKETVCGPHQKTVEECDFKPDGVEKACSGVYTIEQGYRFILALCDDAEKESEPKLREQWRKFRKNVIKKFRKSEKNYASSVVVTMG